MTFVRPPDEPERRRKDGTGVGIGNALNLNCAPSDEDGDKVEPLSDVSIMLVLDLAVICRVAAVELNCPEANAPKSRQRASCQHSQAASAICTNET